ncbi:MAG: acetyl-CoA carboxylase biotin carboxylase subunit [Pseudonocardiaceae bacterium]
MFDRVLIANRGEIAVRVARTCQELGIEVVAVHSTADRESAVVTMADHTVQIGPPAAKRSYLNAAAIIEAALRSGADAIHPGYGLLSEDADFAEACALNGITFIGPPPTVMARLGDKVTARAALSEAGLPMLPGSLRALSSADEAKGVADEIGYPVIIKASAGGGGRAMQVVSQAGEFVQHYRETRAAAQALFGDSRVYVERYLESARHVEVQILCDRHGTALHLGERDCSVQRRHQKLVEEAPAPGLPVELTQRMCEAAVRGALAAGYVGVGTFEFLVDTEGRPYFMEVNCRIQVEHPVTEMITGLDLVAEQLRVAAGEPLALRQAEIHPRGVSMECRINAEDPSRGFAPTPGLLTRFRPPGGPFVRVDTHGYAGYRVPAAYDSLLAKLVVWAPDRPSALARMRRALAEFDIAGPGMHTTAEFLEQVVTHPLFVAAKHDTSLLDELHTETTL